MDSEGWIIVAVVQPILKLAGFVMLKNEESVRRDVLVECHIAPADMDEDNRLLEKQKMKLS